MLTKEFNVLPFAERNKLVFGEGKFIDTFVDNKLQKGFFYRLDSLKIDVIYDKVRHRLLDIIAWEYADERIEFLKMPIEDSYSA